jgi:hypothetical protein
VRREALITDKRLLVARTVLACTLFVAACGTPEIPQSAVPEDADRAARAYLALLVAGETDSAARQLSLLPGRADVRSALAEVSVHLRGANLDSAHLIGAHTVHSTFVGGKRERRVSLSYELHAERGWRIATVNSRDSAGVLRIEGFQVDTLPAPLAELNAFDLSGKPTLYYLWLVAAALASLTCVVAAVVVVRTRSMPRRWLWVVLSLVGLGKFSLNWTTAAVSVQPIAFQLLASGYQRAIPVGPWILSFSLPILAVVALARRRQWLRRSAAQSVGSVTSAE